MKRREFITLLGGAATAPFSWSLPLSAQQSTTPIIGFLGSSSPDLFVSQVRAFRDGLGETGYREGQGLAIEFRWAEGQYDQLPELAADLVRRRVNVIATSGGIPPTRAAKAATATIPIVFVMGDDPVRAGLVASLNKPGGNVTGVTSLNLEVGPKRLQLLRELLPTATMIALLSNPTNPNAEIESKDMQAAASTLGLQLPILHASVEGDFVGAFASVKHLRASALVVGVDAFYISHSKQLAALALHHAVPTIFMFRDFAAAGGLMSYGGSFADTYRQLGIYTGRILKGERPAELPVHQVSKIELIINLKTAKALGLTIPPTLLGRADEVIE